MSYGWLFGSVHVAYSGFKICFLMSLMAAVAHKTKTMSQKMLKYSAELRRTVDSTILFGYIMTAIISHYITINLIRAGCHITCSACLDISCFAFSGPLQSSVAASAPLFWSHTSWKEDPSLHFTCCFPTFSA